MMKEYIKPELIIETWDTENILTESGVQPASLTDNIGDDSTYRNLGSKAYSDIMGFSE